MIAVLKNTWALLLGMLLLMIGNGLQGTLLGVRGSLEQMNSTTMGYIMSAYFIGFLGGSQITPRLLRRVGHVRVFAALGSLVSAAFILYAAVVDPRAWWLFRLMVGFCISGMYVVAESWLNDGANNETRGQALSLYLIVQMAGMVIGQLLLNVGDPGSYDLFVLITVLVSVSFAPILLSTSPAPVHEASRPMKIPDLIKASPLACVGTFLLGGIYANLFAMAPVYATERGMPINEVSYFITSIFVGSLIFQYPIGWFSDRMDRRVLIMLLTAVGSIAAALAVWFGDSFSVLLLVALILGGTSGPLYSLLVAYANDYLEADQMAAASGGLLFLNGSGAMGGPIIVGFLMNNFGIEWFFISITLLMSTICIYGFYRMSQRDTVDTEDMAPYLPISARTTVVSTEYAIEHAEEADLEEKEERDETFSDESEESSE
ncbi:MAG: MFS transporter [Gammaproteobacteria bacterium]|nr:MFS transporter [Gammaproteobacteria bacterium]